MVIKVFDTTSEDSHVHEWRDGDKLTSSDVGFVSDRHRHRVVNGVALPLFRGAHKHRIICREDY